ncbi:preprotein translocase subunit SecG [Sphingomonas sp. MAH-20]|uniref:Protein-export membrane protein SecG n=1 Tax=Sphingomonas horti TaxID=2682842 RepID=A0A6I4IZ03_9SPHN|nr:MULTISPECIES: preprotein translocase subunit SecG [Sphingomonas]MBA2918515.1 preprotein translocase subunit SecG [Sphingomonas sp. CGMCC 1.13658]MVO77482.1 preprotein translocase subunit SecG [Sphingomonas horti]
MFTFLLVLQALIAAGLVTVILIQRSEGGGFTGGSPSGLMSARGAADFLTRATAILATAFVLCCIALATLAAMNQRTGKIDASAVAPAQSAPAPVAAPTTSPNDPLAAAAGQAAGNGAAPTPATK